jgi:hypothetical protein
MPNNGQTVIDTDKARMQAMSDKDVAKLQVLLGDDLI